MKHWIATAALAGATLLTAAAQARDLIWADGTVDNTAGLPGLLLSENSRQVADYAIATNVSYRITAKGEPQISDWRIPADRALNDGTLTAGVILPPSSAPEASTVDWTFALPYRFSEVDLAVGNREGDTPVHYQIQVGDGTTFQTVAEGSCAMTDVMKRIALEPAEGTVLRLRLHAQRWFILEEVAIWGDGTAAPQQTSTVSYETFTLPALPEVPVIDGQPAENDLQQMRQVSLCTLQHPDQPDTLTDAYLAYVPGGIYVAWICREPDMAGRRIKDPAAASAAWPDDMVEVCFNRADVSEGRFAVLTVNSEGQKINDTSRMIDPTFSGKPLDSQSAVQQHPWGWTAEMLLSTVDFVGPERDGRQAWRLALERTRRTGGIAAETETLTSWPYSDAGYFALAPAHFAWIKAHDEQADADVQYQLFPGIAASITTAADFLNWQEALGDLAEAPAVLVPGEPNNPAPAASQVLKQPVAAATPLQLARNESEDLAFYVVNPSGRQVSRPEISLGEFMAADGRKAAGVTGELLVGGIMNTRRNSNVFRPLFDRQSLLERSWLERYLLNGSQIADFPTLELQPAQAALIYVKLTTDQAAPGRYSAPLTIANGPTVPVAVEVVDATLERPAKQAILTWNASTAPFFPVRDADYHRQEAAFRREAGWNIYWEAPESPLWQQAARFPESKIHIQIIPDRLVHGGYSNQISAEDVTPEMRQEVTDYVDEVVERMQKAGLDYDRWYGELWDEPGTTPGVTLMRELVKIIKAHNPAVRLYCDPCCWTDRGFAPADEVLAAYRDWYDLIDLSCPIEGLEDNEKLVELWRKPDRWFNVTYIHPCPGRRLAWTSAAKRLDGWGFYSIFAPRFDPWDDFDGAEMDYLIYFPGNAAPVASLQSEDMREAWEDFVMIQQLRQCGRTAEVDALIADQQLDFPAKRLRLLQWLASEK